METSLPLPELQNQEISLEALSDLLRDLTAVAKVQSVIAKGSNSYASPDELSINEVYDLLQNNRVRGIQIRYEFNGTLWCDTLLRTTQGVRIVRMAM